MSSLSTACFVHKKVSKKKSRSSRASPKKPVKFRNGSSDKRTERLDMFATLWKDVLDAVETVQLNVHFEILNDCVRFVERANKQLLKHGNRDGEIPAAILITGVNMPDHEMVFATLQEMLRNSISPFVVSLSSAKDADSIKTIINKVVATLVTDAHEENDTMKKMKYTMPNLVSWYQNATSTEDALLSPYKASSRRPLSSPKKKRKVVKAARPIIIIFEDFERMLPNVAQDFILICSEYSVKLPIIFVFGVSTSTMAVHKVVSQSSLSKLALETFQSRRSSDFLNCVVNEVFMNAKFPFKVSSRLFKFFEDIFLFNDLSVKTFVNGLKCCLLEYFYENPFAALCCDSRELEQQITSVDDETLDELRKLMSFRSYVDSLPLKEQKALLLDNSYLKKILRSKLGDLFEYHECFFPVLRFLHSLCKDLPRSLLGKQLRESYSLCLEMDISSSKEFLECSKMLRMMAKDELRNTLKNALSSALASSDSCPTVLASLKSDLEMVVNKMEDLKGKAKETNAIQQNLKYVSKTKRAPSAFELCRDELVAVVESYVTKYLRNYRSFVFHEISYIDVLKTAKRELSGSHRGSLQTALEYPSCYLKCKCCESSDRHETAETMPDICIAYKLHTEYNRLINLSDWLQSFNSVICPPDSESDDANTDCNINQEMIARFFHSVAELQFLGFIKPAAQRKTDHVVRYTW